MSYKKLLCGMVIALAVLTGSAAAQRVNPQSNTERGGVDVKQVAGRKIGNITTRDDIIQLELDENVIADHHLFDLDRRTLRFTPANGGFRAENMTASVGHGDRICGAGDYGSAHKVFVSVLRPELGLDAGVDHRAHHLWRRIQRPGPRPLRPPSASGPGHRQQDSTHCCLPQTADDRHAVRERTRRPAGRDMGSERARWRPAGRDVCANAPPLPGGTPSRRTDRSLISGDDCAGMPSSACTPCRPAARRPRRRRTYHP